MPPTRQVGRNSNKEKLQKIEKVSLKEDGNLSSLALTMPPTRLERRKKEMAKQIPKLEVITIGKPELTALTAGEQKTLQNTLLERILKLHNEYAEGGTTL